MPSRLPIRLGNAGALWWRRRKLSGTTFAPTEIPGILWWFRADGLALNDGDLVGTWPDASGNGKHATAAGGLRPTFKSNIVNGKPVVRFNGSSQAMVIPATDMTATPAVTLYIVAKVTASVSDKMLIETGTSASAVGGFFLDFMSTNQAKFLVRGTVNNEFTTTAPATGAFARFRCLGDFTLAGGETTIWVNGTSTGSNTVNNDNASSARFLNVITNLGARTGASIWCPADVAEIILYNRALTAAEVVQVDSYLTGKYAL